MWENLQTLIFSQRGQRPFVDSGIQRILLFDVWASGGHSIEVGDKRLKSNKFTFVGLKILGHCPDLCRSVRPLTERIE